MSIDLVCGVGCIATIEASPVDDDTYRGVDDTGRTWECRDVQRDDVTTFSRQFVLIDGGQTGDDLIGDDWDD